MHLVVSGFVVSFGLMVSVMVVGVCLNRWLDSSSLIGLLIQRFLSMGRSLFRKLLFDDSDEDEIMNRRLKSSTSQRKRRRYIRRNHLVEKR
ncbi:hypothetical protein CMV_006055 [Castanea mollissima]|uniref:Transmembrane protein n=1 Tax=Castanea mollissima TaxID=60419 RepID=A0A8J4RPD4_9ROSI|nr:hypothetical protein CMV_006055 [Castanea mollissima]